MPFTSSLDTVVEVSPLIRTRLVPPQREAPDFTCLYLSAALTVAFTCFTAYWIFEYSFTSSVSSYMLVGTTIFLLLINAYLGVRAWMKLQEFEENQYSEYVYKLAQMNTHEKLNRSVASPIWIERTVLANSV